ncbi:hypothetical protein N9980_02005 [bacterium]|nr:hypothetical protein [bacterium]
MKTWLFEHFRYASERWGWIPLGQMSFRKERWTTSRILSDVTAWNEPMIETEVHKILDGEGYRDEPLVAYMIENGTWPEAPLLLAGDGVLTTPDGELVPAYWLIEGHHRLGALYALVQSPRWHPSDEHDVWMLEID